jgi:hypothetical protein
MPDTRHGRSHHDLAGRHAPIDRAVLRRCARLKTCNRVVNAVRRTATKSFDVKRSPIVLELGRYAPVDARSMSRAKFTVERAHRSLTIPSSIRMHEIFRVHFVTLCSCCRRQRQRAPLTMKRGRTMHRSRLFVTTFNLLEVLNTELVEQTVNVLG